MERCRLRSPARLDPAGGMRGVTAVVRILILVGFSLAVSSSTTATQISDAVVRLLRPLAHFGMPVAALGTVLSLALRFIPLVSEELGRIRLAQRARGARFDEGGLVERIRIWGSVLTPLMVGLFRRADRLAEAMSARCYDASSEGRLPVPRPLGHRDRALLVVSDVHGGSDRRFFDRMSPMKGDSMTKTATIDAVPVSGAYPAVDELDGTLVFRLGYDGAAFSGFAEQPEGLRTVAGEVRRALETFLHRPVDLTCAGRTDAGVHAVSQYVSIPAHAEELAITHARWMRAMAALLPSDIALNAVYHARPGFSPCPFRRSLAYLHVSHRHGGCASAAHAFRHVVASTAARYGCHGARRGVPGGRGDHRQPLDILRYRQAHVPQRHCCFV